MKKLKITLLFSFIFLIFLSYKIQVKYKIPNSNYLIGIVQDIKNDGDKLTFDIKSKKRVIANYYIKKEYEKKLISNSIKMGYIVKLKGKYKEVSNNTNFNLFNYKKYLLSKKIYYTFDIEEIINYMDNNDIFFYRLSLRSDLDKKYIRHQITGESVYAINLQPVIWNRENFISKLEMLQTLGCKSPWDFERYFINYFENKKTKEIISGIIYDTRDIMGFKNAVIQGKWVRHVIKFYKDEFGIILDIGSRECMSYFAEFFDYVKLKEIIL